MCLGHVDAGTAPIAARRPGRHSCGPQAGATGYYAPPAMPRRRRLTARGGSVDAEAFVAFAACPRSTVASVARVELLLPRRARVPAYHSGAAQHATWLPVQVHTLAPSAVLRPGGVSPANL